MGYKVFIQLISWQLSEIIIASYLEDVCNIPKFSSNLVLEAQVGRFALWFEPKPQNQPQIAFEPRLHSQC